MAKGILLESGTNEMELLVFRVGDARYGINVAKVREMIPKPETVHVPYAAPAVEGTFRLRDRIMTLINLRRYLEAGESEADAGARQQLIVVIEFNQLQCGVLVDAVDTIHRMHWKEIEPPSRFLEAMDAPVTGIAKPGDEIVMILDFERIVAEVLGLKDTEIEPQVAAPLKESHHEVRVLIADDSGTIRAAVERVLRSAGFGQVTACTDGQEAWELLEKLRGGDEPPFDLVLSDIEMPRMDGLHLTSRIKSDESLRDMVVVLFSSLISDDNRKKGEQVGADAQVTKFQSDELIHAIDQLLIAHEVMRPGAAEA